MSKKPSLKKNLKTFGVFAIATGATLSSGFFLLPGIAAREAGPALVLAYMLAVIPLIPATFSIVELSTAMPKAGGVYYFLDRSLGPLFGTIGGLGTWLALMLKVSFALVGMGYYIALLIPAMGETHTIMVAVALAVLLGLMNAKSAHGSGGLQIWLVIGLLTLLALYVGGGLFHLEPAHFENFLGSGWNHILETTGLVYISYVGITKVASLAEEVENPERNLPRGVFFSLAVAILVYGAGTFVLVGLVPMGELTGSYTPMALGAGKIFGKTGVILMSIAALMAFISVANAGMMSSSRYPLAMARDRLMPRFFRYLGPSRTPVYSLGVTVAIVVSIIVFLDPLKIAKLASAFQLLMFALVCLAVVVMRESNIESYDPGYKSPLYPWMQIVGIFLPFLFIAEMGWMPSLFSTGLVLVGIIWYYNYGRKKVKRSGAIFHIFERLGQQRYEGLDYELREILKEKGLRDEDPFESMIARSSVLEIEEGESFEQVTQKVANHFAKKSKLTKEEIINGFLEGTRVGATPVAHGVALPHMRSDLIEQPELVLVRARNGLEIEQTGADNKHVFALFFLLSPSNDPARHLRILAQLAGRVDEDDFKEKWLKEDHKTSLQRVLLRDENSLHLFVKTNSRSGVLISKSMGELKLPDGCLVAMIRRNDRVIIPRGTTRIKENDRLTIIGEIEAIAEVTQNYYG